MRSPGERCVSRHEEATEPPAAASDSFRVISDGHKQVETKRKDRRRGGQERLFSASRSLLLAEAPTTPMRIKTTER